MLNDIDVVPAFEDEDAPGDEHDLAAGEAELGGVGLEALNRRRDEHLHSQAKLAKNFAFGGAPFRGSMGGRR